MCVLHMKPFFLPIDIHHTPYPYCFFILEGCMLCGHKTTAQRYYIVALYKGRRQCNAAMPSYWIPQAQHTHVSNPDALKERKHE